MWKTDPLHPFPTLHVYASHERRGWHDLAAFIESFKIGDARCYRVVAADHGNGKEKKESVVLGI